MKKLITIIILISIVCSCSSDKWNKENMGFFDKLFGKNNANQLKTNAEDINYKNRLLAAKKITHSTDGDKVITTASHNIQLKTATE